MKVPKNQAILRVFEEMPITLRLIGLMVAITMTISFALSCSNDTSETQETAQIDTSSQAPVRETVANVRRLTIGGSAENNPDSLRVIDPQTFSDWKVTTYENIRLLCPSDHAHLADINRLAKSFSDAMDNACRFLEINKPQETIVVLYYTGPGQAREITGMNRSFVLGDTLHHWPPNNLGLPIIKYLIPKWQDIEPRHKFLRNGLVTLLNNPGNNYHKRTLHSYNDNTFWPLRELAVDSALNGYSERRESAMAASFVDFVAYRYGVEKLAELYRSEDEFGATVEKTFGVSTEDLQTLWIGLLEQVVPSMEK